MKTSAPTSGEDPRSALSVALGGETVDLLPERALHWARGATLFVADVHLGKAAAFRAGGVPLPGGSTRSDLARLTRALERTGARRLIVLGDFLHARAGRVAALEDAFAGWRSRHRTLDIVVVRGNHDAHAGDPPPHWGIEVVDEGFCLPPFLLCHEPGRRAGGYALAGHVHPGVRLSDGIGAGVRLSCFVLGHAQAILPAFGSFTGLEIVRPRRDERVVAIAGSRLFPIRVPV